MKAMQHENIVLLYDVIVGTEYIYMILEYCDGGDFSEYLKGNRLSEDVARLFLRQLAAGLKFLHSRNIIHRDLKPQNLLLSFSDNRKPVLKIADFGFARFIEPQSVANTLCGSPLYMAPEILLCQPYDAKADLWSVGAILYEMLTGSPPFNVKTHIELVKILVTTKVRFPKHLRVSSECRDLLQGLLKKNRDDRISWDDFFCHPFLLSPSSANVSSPSEPKEDVHSTGVRSPSSALLEPIADFETVDIPAKSNDPRSKGEDPTAGGSSGTYPLLLRRPKTNPFKESVSHSQDLENEFNEFSAINSAEVGTSSEDSFELISSKSVSASSQLSAQQKQIIDEIEARCERVNLVAELADIKVGAQQPVEALALYVKALKTYQELLNLTKKIIDGSHEIGLASSPRLGVVVENMRRQFAASLSKAEYWKRNLKPTDSAVCAELCLYDFALQMGKEAAIAEVFHHYEKAHSMYTKGLMILQELADEALETADKEILTLCILFIFPSPLKPTIISP
jgi:serine/threonine protein kinase